MSDSLLLGETLSATLIVSYASMNASGTVKNDGDCDGVCEKANENATSSAIPTSKRDCVHGGHANESAICCPFCCRKVSEISIDSSSANQNATEIVSENASQNAIVGRDYGSEIDHHHHHDHRRDHL